MKQRKNYLLLFTLLAILFVSCKDETEQTTYAPIIEDQADCLNVRVKELFLNYEYPPGLVPVIHTAENIPLLETGVYADRYFKEYSKLHPESKAFKKRGFLIVVSRDPDLIQVRLGNVYRTYCNMRGVTAGPDYLQLQSQLHELGTEQSVASFLDMISTKVTEYNELSPGQKSQINQAVGFINNSLRHLATPSENLYGKFFLIPSLKCVSWLYSLTESWLSAFLAITFVLFLGRYLFRKGLGIICKDPVTVLILQKIIWGGLSLIYSLSAAAAAVVLSSGRMEDYLALHSLNIPFLQNFQIAAEDYVLTTPLLSAACFVLLYSFKKICTDAFILSLMDGETQRIKYAGLMEGNREGLLAFHNADKEKIAASNEPFTEMVASRDSHYQSFAGMALAAFFIIPKPLILISIALLIYPVLDRLYQCYKTVSDSRLSHSQKKERQGQALLQFSIIIVLTAIMTGFAYFSNPIDDKNENEEQLLKTELIAEETFNGEYTLTIKHNGKTNQQLTARFEKQRRNKYQLTVNWPEGAKVYSATYNKKGQTFLSDEMGPATVFFYEEFNKLFIIFTPASNVTWELEK